MGGTVVGIGGMRNGIVSVGTLGIAKVCKSGIVGVRVTVGYLATLGSVTVTLVFAL